MDPDKIFKFLGDNLTDWSRVTVLTLSRPVTRFELVAADSSENTCIIGYCQSERQLWLHPKLLAFAVLSIVLGITISALIPNRKPSPTLLASVIIILTHWFAWSSFLHLICRLLWGKGRYLETLSVSIQVLATLYVVTSFLSLLAATILTMPQIVQRIEKIPLIGEILVKEPVYVFFLIGTVLLMLYVPLAVRSVHKFGWIRTTVIALIPPSTVSLVALATQSLGLVIAIYRQVGILMLPFGSPK